MATNFPTSLDSLTNPQSTDSVELVSHAAQHANANDAIEALEAKVGANNSSVTTSLDYRVRDLESTRVTQTNLNNTLDGYVTIGDVGNPDGIATLGPDGYVPASQLNLAETIQDTAALMFTSATHSNITVAYDDSTGRLSLTGIPLTQEQVQDFIAPLFAHAYHTNVTATYDDTNNRVILESSGGGGGSGTGGSLTNSWWLGS